MGNSFGRKRNAEVMKIDGETFKFKTPIRVGSVVADYPGHVLLDAEAVRYYGVRAKPLELRQELQAKRLYFLVELPKSTEERDLRRARSGIHTTGAKERLESLMLTRRSTSDLSLAKRLSIVVEEEGKEAISRNRLRVKMRLPKAEVKRLMAESENESEAGEKILSLYASAGNGVHGAEQNLPPWKGGHAAVKLKRGMKQHEKRVGFLPIEREIHLVPCF